MAEVAKVVGVLAPGPLRPIASFERRLNELGWVEGRNIRFEERWGESDEARYPVFAVELAAIPANAILTWGTPALLAAKQATTTIPIVMGTIGDPLSVGAVANLARPGGNVTGFTSQNYELEDKPHSMTSSARASRDCGTVRPSAAAVLRLMTSSNLVGCWTGRSAGFSPLRIFPV
jgi:hypothetical protein